MSKAVFERIKELLRNNDVSYKEFHHKKVLTSGEAAKARGTRIDQGAKSLIMMSSDRELIDVVVPADKRVHLRKVKRFINSKNVSLVHPDEVLRATDCEVGSVPPFGNIFSIRVLLDREFVNKKEMAFSAGTHYDSLMIKVEDYIRVVSPEIGDFSRSSDSERELK